MQGSNIFAGKHGLITPRDLFRWASDGAVGYQQLAETGYMLLAERLRHAGDRMAVQQVLEKEMNVKVRCPGPFSAVSALHLTINSIMTLLWPCMWHLPADSTWLAGLLVQAWVVAGTLLLQP